MFKVSFRTSAGLLETEAAPGETLSAVLARAGADMALPCGGNHRCGKCRVSLEGSVPEMSREEAALLSGAENVRLACFAKVCGDVSVALPQAAPERVLLAADSLSGGGAERTFAPGEAGAAFDIGTTTVAGYLFTGDAGEPAVSMGETNCQQRFGADVLSRISYCMEHGVGEAQRAICAQLSALLSAMLVRAELPQSALAALCITGNTTMLHILCGLDPSPLARAPFTPRSLFGGMYALELPGYSCPAYLPPCVSAYIGADITCGMLASGLTSMPDDTLLVDVGTNGEMALWHDHALYCCSTAAGPAFEGANISMGSRAVPGAIDSVRFAGGRIEYSVLGGIPAKTICGSGLIDAMRAFTESGSVLPNGRIRPGCPSPLPVGDSAVSVTQQDIRLFQMAKGAIRAGIALLCAHCGLSESELHAILLCGGFGSALDPLSAEKTGLLPPGTAARTRSAGNVAGAGACMLLRSPALRREAESLAARSRVHELSEDPAFLRAYMKAMAFPEPALPPSAPSAGE